MAPADAPLKSENYYLQEQKNRALHQSLPATPSVSCGYRYRKPLTPATMARKALIKEVALSILTAGIYTIFWAVELKQDLNRLGANIPTAWLMIIPFANIYFWYQFIDGYRWVMYGKTDETVPLLGGFCIALLPSGQLLALLTMQSEINGRLDQLSLPTPQRDHWPSDTLLSYEPYRAA